MTNSFDQLDHISLNKNLDKDTVVFYDGDIIKIVTNFTSVTPVPEKATSAVVSFKNLVFGSTALNSPTGPTAPVTPTGPSAPVAPTGNTGSTSATVPTGPTNILNTVANSGPTAPTASTGPKPTLTGPTGPTGSVDSGLNPTIVSVSNGAVAAKPDNQIINIVNMSTVLTDAQVQQAIIDIQTQITRDFFPAWGTAATLQFLAKDQKIPAKNWSVLIMDTSDQQGAAGYHDLNNNLPQGKIFAKDDAKYGLSWTVTLSHELLEMLCDPWVIATCFVQSSNTTGVIVPQENCDAVEDDSLGYKINNTLVSDFVFPAWFNETATPMAKYDFCNHLAHPLQVAPGGYISTFAVPNDGSGWKQNMAETTPSNRLKQKLENPASRLSSRVLKINPNILNNIPTNVVS